MLKLVVERPSAVYELGETAAFRAETVQGSDAMPRSLRYSVVQDGMILINRGVVRAKNLPYRVLVQCTQPGFLRASMDLPRTGAGAVEAAAAVAPERIAPSLPAPHDFDEFWADQVETNISGPIQATVARFANWREASVWRVVVGMPGGRNIRGWLLRPQGAGPFPGIIRYHGSGVYGLSPENGLDWVRRGFMVFSINPHPVPNDWPQEFYDRLRKTSLARYATQGRTSREKLYFREMFLRAARAAQFLSEQGCWDGNNLIVEGHSLGGAQAIAAAALANKVSGLVASCPTHCDHTAFIWGRAPAWPRMVEVRCGVPNMAHMAASRYFDAVNFASRIRCPALIGLGFLDQICPPAGIYAAYNMLRGPKKIHHEVAAGHVHTDEFRERAYAWGLELVGKE